MVDVWWSNSPIGCMVYRCTNGGLWGDPISRQWCLWVVKCEAPIVLQKHPSQYPRNPPSNPSIEAPIVLQKHPSQYPMESSLQPTIEAPIVLQEHSSQYPRNPPSKHHRTPLTLKSGCFCGIWRVFLGFPASWWQIILSRDLQEIEGQRYRRPQTNYFEGGSNWSQVLQYTGRIATVCTHYGWWVFKSTCGNLFSF
jgi:hypothetical protein